jgi:hypothetical protein
MAFWLERPSQVPTVSRQGAGSIPAGDDSFVLAALHQRMEMSLVKSLHSGDSDVLGLLLTHEKHVIMLFGLHSSTIHVCPAVSHQCVCNKPC